MASCVEQCQYENATKSISKVYLKVPKSWTLVKANQREKNNIDIDIEYLVTLSDRKTELKFDKCTRGFFSLFIWHSYFYERVVILLIFFFVTLLIQTKMFEWQLVACRFMFFSLLMTPDADKCQRKKFYNFLVNEWMNVRLVEWMNERTNESNQFARGQIAKTIATMLLLVFKVEKLSIRCQTIQYISDNHFDLKLCESYSSGH